MLERDTILYGKQLIEKVAFDTDNISLPVGGALAGGAVTGIGAFIPGAVKALRFQKEHPFHVKTLAELVHATNRNAAIATLLGAGLGGGLGGYFMHQRNRPLYEKPEGQAELGALGAGLSLVAGAVARGAVREALRRRAERAEARVPEDSSEYFSQF